MRRTKNVILASLISLPALASAQALTLQSYLEQVKTRNPEAVGLSQSVTATKLQLAETHKSTVTEFYAKYNLGDDRKENAQPLFQGNRTKFTKWKSGLKQKTILGLDAELFFEGATTSQSGVSPQFSIEPNEARAGLELRQALWRNSFGEVTRADLAALESKVKAEYFKKRNEFKNLILKAENAFFKLEALTQIVQLQKDNVERARKLRDLMRKRSSLRLIDSVEYLQAQAALEAQELELQASIDDLAATARTFNILRGLESEQVPTLQSGAENQIENFKTPAKGKLMRDDFQAGVEAAKAAKAESKSARSSINPQLDLVGGVFSHGRSMDRKESYDEVYAGTYPAWTVGVEFSVGLDLGDLSSARKGRRQAILAAENNERHFHIQNKYVLDDLVKRLGDANKRFEMAKSLEKVRTELVKRERSRLNNGRTTTFQFIEAERQLTQSQIQRVQVQLQLLEIQNTLKTFEEQI